MPRWLFWIGFAATALILGPLALDRGDALLRRFEAALISNGYLQHNARVTVASPAVYSRERLLNDRFEQVAWLDRLLRESESLPNQLTHAPAPGATTPPSPPTSGTTTAEASGLARQRAVTQAWTPRHSFEFVNSYRDVLRAERAREMLDDGHDMDAGTLHLLSFDTTVAAREGARGFAAVEAVLTRDATALRGATYELLDALLTGEPTRATRAPAGLIEAAQRLEDLRLQDALDLYVLWMRRVRSTLSSGVSNLADRLAPVLDNPQEPPVPDLLTKLRLDACIALTWLQSPGWGLEKYRATRDDCTIELAGRDFSLRSVMERGELAHASQSKPFAIQHAAMIAAFDAFADHLATLHIINNARTVTAQLGAWRQLGVPVNFATNGLANARDIFERQQGCTQGRAVLSRIGVELLAELRALIDLDVLHAEQTAPGTPPDPRSQAFELFLTSVKVTEDSAAGRETSGTYYFDCAPLRTRLLTPLRQAQLWLAVIRWATAPSEQRQRVTLGALDFQMRLPAQTTDSPALIVSGEEIGGRQWLTCLAAHYLRSVYDDPSIGNINHYGGRLSDFFSLEITRRQDGSCDLVAQPLIQSMLPGARAAGGIVVGPLGGLPELPLFWAVPAASGSILQLPAFSLGTPSTIDFQEHFGFQDFAEEHFLGDRLNDFRVQRTWQRRMAMRMRVSRDARIAVRVARRGSPIEHGRLALVHQASAPSVDQPASLAVQWRGPGTLQQFCGEGCEVQRDRDATLLLQLITLLEGPGYTERDGRPVLRAATYSLSPRLRQAFSRQNTLVGGMRPTLLGQELPFSDGEQLYRAGLEPEVVGFTRSVQDERGRLARFGWLILPPPDIGGSGVWSNATQQAQLGAIVSMPSWWRSALIQVCHGFAGGAAPGVLDEAFWAHDRLTCHVEVVRLPGTANDVSRRLGVEVITYPYLNPPAANPQAVPAGANVFPQLRVGQRRARVLLRGERLWRSTVVTLDAQRADRIEVLPDMSGIVAHFDCIAHPTGHVNQRQLVVPDQQPPRPPRWVRQPPPPTPQVGQERTASATLNPTQPGPVADGAQEAWSNGSQRGGPPNQRAVMPPPDVQYDVRLIAWTSEGNAEFLAQLVVPGNARYDVCYEGPAATGTVSRREAPPQ
jgi:hypothetical protein